MDLGVVVVVVWGWGWWCGDGGGGGGGWVGGMGGGGWFTIKALLMYYRLDDIYLYFVFSEYITDVECTADLEFREANDIRKSFPSAHASMCLYSATFLIVSGMQRTLKSWWRHQMETFSALLAICAGNSPVPGEFTSQRPVTRSFDVFCDLRLNKRLSKQS